MSLEFYKIIHLVAIMGLFFSFGVVGASFLSNPNVKGLLRIFGIVGHGVSLLLIFVSGFGMSARLGYFSALPSWVTAKILVWVLFGLALTLVKRKPRFLVFNFALLLGLGLMAAYLGVMKPF